jgi:hypothetical protein
MREEVLKYQRIIHKYLGRYGLTSHQEAEELEEAYHQMRQIQERCFHQFHKETLFTTDSQVCEYCGYQRNSPSEQEAG